MCPGGNSGALLIAVYLLPKLPIWDLHVLILGVSTVNSGVKGLEEIRCIFLRENVGSRQDPTWRETVHRTVS